MSSSTSSSRPPWRRALYRLALFLLFLLAFDRLLFLGLRAAEEAYSRRTVAATLQEKFAAVRDRDEVRVLILGTSRAFEGIHPAWIRKRLGVRSFKEAFVGKGPKYNYFFYQEYKKHMPLPRVVVYGVDYFLFNIKSERHWLQRFPQALVGQDRPNRGVSLLLANKAQTDRFFQLLLDGLKAETGGDANYQAEMDPERMEAYCGAASSGAIDPERPSHFKRVLFPRPPGQEGRFFKRLLLRAREDGVQVLLVALPDYIGTYWTNRGQKKFRDYFRRLDKSFANVRFLNYNDPRAFALERAELFLDGGYGHTNSHLSRSGAEIFNRLLIEDLRRHLEAK